MIRKALGRIAAIGVLLAVPGILEAAANTWTGGRLAEIGGWGRNLVAAHPDDPDVVYAGFEGELLRASSRDGGRSWSHLRSFEGITALLIHPASPSTIYLAASEVELHSGVYKSEDSGETWSRVLDGYVAVLAGSPTDASVALAGTNQGIYNTTDAGATWSLAWVDSVSPVMSSLLFHPREPGTAYAGVEGFEYWGLDPGGLFKTTDGGSQWRRTGPEAEGISAVAVDAAAESILYVATGLSWWGDEYEVPSSLLRSEDGGETWAAAGEGLSGVTVRSLGADPHVSGTLYAGTSAGVFRTRDGGRKWTPFGQKLGGAPIRALSIDGGGRRLIAGTSNGVYELEIARGPLDVAAGPAGGSRLLVWDGERVSIGTLDASGGWTSGPPGQASATWTAIALAEGGGGRTHVLWQDGGGRSALEIVGPAGRQSATVFGKRSGWIASEISVRADGQANVLWTDADGRMLIARVDSSGATTDGPEYGPAPGWSAIAIADGPGGDTWVLWRSTDGRSSLSVHRDGTMVASHRYAAHPDGAVEDVAVAADGRPRILRTNPAGLASLATVDATGRLTAEQHYELPGFTPRRIAAGADGQIRLLFGSSAGQGELLLLNPDNTLRGQHSLPVSE